ncbi:MAG TPA: hypothetical protein VN278_07150, partial [Methanosarcina sp.]|nr:hypothetical protein [Methanosarcina sp.]
GIIESELETIRRINENENKLDTFFKKYETSRKLFQGLLIPTTSNCLKDKSYIMGMQNAEINSDNIAESIFQFRNKIASLKEWQSRLEDYRQLWDESTRLENAINSVIGVYQARDTIIHEAATQYKSYELVIKELSQKLTDLNAQIATVTRECNECKNDICLNRLKISESNLNHDRVELERLNRTRYDVAELLKNAEYELNFARAMGKYVQIKECRENINVLQKQLENIEKSNEELYGDLVQSGAVLYSRYTALLAGLQEEHQVYRSEHASKKIEYETTLELRGEREGDIKRSKEGRGHNETKLKNLAKKESEVRKSLIAHTQAHFEHFDIGGEYEKTQKAIVDLTKEQEDAEALHDQLTSEERDLEIKCVKVSNEISLVESKIKEISQQLEKYTFKLKNVIDTCAIYETTDIDTCDSKIEQELARYNREKVYLEDRRAGLEKRLKSIDKYGYDIIDGSIEEIKTKLNNSFVTVIYGMEHLKQLPEADHVNVLKKIPWLPKAMFVGRKEFESIINNPFKLPVSIQDSAVIIASVDLLNPNSSNTTGDIFVPHRDATYYTNLLSKEKTMIPIQNEIVSITNKLDSITRYVEEVNKHYYSITSFKKEYVDEYVNGYEPKLRSQLDVLNSKLNELNCAYSALETQVQNIQGKLTHNSTTKSELKKKIIALTEKGKLLDTLNCVITDSSEVESKLKQVNLLISDYEKEIVLIDIHKTEQGQELNQINESIRQLEKTINTIKGHVEKFKTYAGKSSDAMESIKTEYLHSKFEANKETLREKGASIEHLTREISNNEARISELTKDIVNVYKIQWDLIEQHDPQLALSDEYITTLEIHKDELRSKYDQADKKCRDAEIEYRVQKGVFDNNVKKFQALPGNVYAYDSNLMDPNEYERNLHSLQVRISILEKSTSGLLSDVKNTENAKNSAQNEFNLFSQLDGEYGLSKISVSVTLSLKSYREINQQIGECTNSLGKARVAFRQTRQQLQKTAIDLKVGVHYGDSFEVKFGDPESLTDANLTAKNVKEYRNGLSADIQTAEIELARLEEDETNIVNLIIQCNKVYMDYLKGFANASRIKTHDGNTRLMISTNLDQCIYSDEQSALNVRSFIRKILDSKDATRHSIGEMTIPAKLLECVIDMSSIKVQILKIDIKGYVRQPWDNINASGGQINAIYIMFLAVLFSYIRKIVIDQSALSTSKVLIVDNPFGTTGSAYLWDDIWTILERNNIQLICPTHTISPKIRSFFPKSYVLVNKFSTDNTVKVCIKEANHNKESVKRTKELMYGQLTLTEEDM